MSRTRRVVHVINSVFSNGDVLFHKTNGKQCLHALLADEKDDEEHDDEDVDALLLPAAGADDAEECEEKGLNNLPVIYCTDGTCRLLFPLLLLPALRLLLPFVCRLTIGRKSFDPA